MLSVGAFNALLKTLEEPPEHVKFILATTEPQKLPATILSRCQRFDYKKISPENIKFRLDYICKECNISITEQALKTISVLAEGAMRDGLSILERCVQEGEDEITDDKVKELVGIPKVEYINKIVDDVIDYNVEETLRSIDIVIDEGKDLNNLIWEIIKYVKDILVYKASGKLSLYSEDELQKISKIADKTTKERLLKIIYDLSELANDLKMTTQKTIMLEVGIMKLCNKVEEQEKVNIESSVYATFPSELETQNVGPNVVNNVNAGSDVNQQTNLNNKEIENRIKELENKLNRITNLIIHNQEVNVDKSTDKTTNTRKTVTRSSSNAPTNIVKNITPTGKKVEGWSKMVKGLKESGDVMLYMNLLNTSATELNDMTVGIVFPKGITAFGKSVLDKPESVAALSKIISMEFGKTMQVRYIDAKHPEQAKDIVGEISKEMGMPINVIDG